MIVLNSKSIIGKLTSLRRWCRGILSIIDFEHSINKSTYVLKDKVSLFGTPGFYETNLNISGNQPEDVTGLVYLLYWSQFPKRFKEFMKLDYKDAIRYTIEFEKSRLYCINTDNMFFGIFKKSFKHEYNSLILSIIMCYYLLKCLIFLTF